MHTHTENKQANKRDKVNNPSESEASYPNNSFNVHLKQSAPHLPLVTEWGKFPQRPDENHHLAVGLTVPDTPKVLQLLQFDRKVFTIFRGDLVPGLAQTQD